MKKKVIIIIVIVIILLLILAYFLFFNKTTRAYFGFSPLDFSNIDIGGNLGKATDTNAWENVKLNPFRNET